MKVNGKTSLYGIVGNPVSHSLSPLMHNRAFVERGIDGVYVPFPVENVEAALTGIRGLGIRGVSVTVPHKQAVMQYLDHIDPVAEKIGAVNTINVIHSSDGAELHGSNTDWLGANRALEQVIPLAGKKVVLLGAGGSARAIGFGLLEAGTEVSLCSRTEKTGRELADALDCPWYSLDQAAGLHGDILVNATSVGMHPHDDISLMPAANLESFQVVMDIVYAPLETRLLREAAGRGCETINGLEMLLYQGVAQFETWTGVEAPVKLMRDTLLEATGNK